jgi:hypothetical protein
MKKQTVSVTTDANGDATAYSTPVDGRILKIKYNKDASTPYADTVDFTITTETTAQGVWAKENVTASTQVSPREATHTTAGVAALYAAGGSAVLGHHVYADNERIKIVLAAGGASKIGTFDIYTDG